MGLTKFMRRYNCDHYQARGVKGQGVEGQGLKVG